MVIEYFRKVKNRERTFENGVDVTDPHFQVLAMHSLTEALKFASLATVTGWPALTLLQRSFIRGIKRPKAGSFFRMMTFGHLLYNSAIIAYQTEKGRYNYGAVAYRAQNDKKGLQYENWGLGTALAFGFIGAFMPSLTLTKMATLGFSSGYLFILSSDYLTKKGYVDKKELNQFKKKINLLRTLSYFSVSGGYDIGFDDDED